MAPPQLLINASYKVGGEAFAPISKALGKLTKFIKESSRNKRDCHWVCLSLAEDSPQTLCRGGPVYIDSLSRLVFMKVEKNIKIPLKSTQGTEDWGPRKGCGSLSWSQVLLGYVVPVTTSCNSFYFSSSTWNNLLPSCLSHAQPSPRSLYI